MLLVLNIIISSLTLYHTITTLTTLKKQPFNSLSDDRLLDLSKSKASPEKKRNKAKKKILTYLWKN